uniref:AlNc14C23G2327 protein n=1 Tax=Albugo laibachii Nc14 TaxID=890382 RepID=F0W623_9STRA|nr:AlNc14C23G2327 [Albugo laibachii Nc14]|eukprot:CCA16565.1 AlNc14C23G2327 [Albugo laibachii Nc14]
MLWAQFEQAESECATGNKCQWSRKTASVFYWKSEEPKVLRGATGVALRALLLCERKGLNAARFKQMQDNHGVNVLGSSTTDPYKVDILTGMQLAIAAWRDVSEEAIINCWKHFRVHPAPGLHEVEKRDLEYTFHMESDRNANSL